MTDTSNLPVKDLVEVTKGVLEKVPIYEDAIQPCAKEIGKALGTVGKVINVALSPLSAVVYGFSKIKNQLQIKLEKKLLNINPANIISPPLNLVGPLIEKYRYSYDQPELAEMFENLLANAMDKEHTKKAHPSFVDIISNLCSEEAKLLKTIYSQEAIPLINVKFEINDKNDYIFAYKNFTNLGEITTLNKEFIPSYINNIERLGIISVISATEYYSDESLYKQLIEHKFIKRLEKDAKEKKQTMKIDKGYIQITEFGKNFLQTVLTKL